jgi:hypothetical protein
MNAFLKIVSVSFFLFLFQNAMFGQEDYAAKRNSSKADSDRKVLFGGSFGASFGSYTYIELSPKIAYLLTDKALAGIGLTGVYSKVSYDIINPATWVKTGTFNHESSLYGGSLFAEYLLVENFFPHIEYEALNFEYLIYDYNRSDYIEDRTWVHSFFVGGGIRQYFGQNSFISIMFLYNLNHQSLSPYDQPYVVRFGVFL